jgi:prophage regulatory protein
MRWIVRAVALRNVSDYTHMSRTNRHHAAAAAAALNPDRIVRVPEAVALTGLSRSTIYAAVKDGRFPAPMRLSLKAVGWRAAVLNAWLAARAGGAK